MNELAILNMILSADVMILCFMGMAFAKVDIDRGIKKAKYNMAYLVIMLLISSSTLAYSICTIVT